MAAPTTTSATCTERTIPGPCEKTATRASGRLIRCGPAVYATGVVAASVAADLQVARYRPGILSQTLNWVDGLPLHGWWAYPLLALVLFLWSHGVLWLTGQLPVGTIQPLLASAVFYGPFVLAAIAYINRVSERALAQFWPATGWPADEQAAWRYEFVNSPGGVGLITLVVGILAAAGSFASGSDLAIDPRLDRGTFLVAYLPSAVIGYGLVVAATVHIVRQLRLVARIHREAKAIDPFDRGPVYAFSNLTARAGLAYIISGYYAITVQGQFQAGNAVSLVVIAITFTVGICCFVLPLWGIHERLGREKDGLLREVETRAGRLGEEMYRRIDAGQFDGTKVVSEALAGAGALRDRINRLPTWPWPPNLMRGFISALLLPVIVYVVTRSIGGRIGL